jgi:hypothetical protein
MKREASGIDPLLYLKILNKQNGRNEIKNFFFAEQIYPKHGTLHVWSGGVLVWKYKESGGGGGGNKHDAVHEIS